MLVSNLAAGQAEVLVPGAQTTTGCQKPRTSRAGAGMLHGMATHNVDGLSLFIQYLAFHHESSHYVGPWHILHTYCTVQ